MRGILCGLVILYDYLTRIKASGAVMAAFGTPGRPQMLAASPLRTGLSVPVLGNSTMLGTEADTFGFRGRTFRSAGTGTLGASSDSPLTAGRSVPVPGNSRLLGLEAATFGFRGRTLRTAGTGILGASDDSSTRTI